MTKEELERRLAEAKASLLPLQKNAQRYEWLKTYAHGANFDELTNMDESEWDSYIDKAINRR